MKKDGSLVPVFRQMPLENNNDIGKLMNEKTL
jgi:hypothetical protein